MKAKTDTKATTEELVPGITPPPEGYEEVKLADGKVIWAKCDGTGIWVKEEAAVVVGNGVLKPSLAHDSTDPFAKYKTETDKYYYRAINIRPQNMRTRKAEGYETIPDTEHGDLILARLPLAERERRVEREEKKIEQRSRAAVDQFKLEAEKLGVKTFEE